MLNHYSWGAVASAGAGGMRRPRSTPEKLPHEETPHRVGAGFLHWSAAYAYASAKLRVTAGSTGMPGPVVVETTTFADKVNGRRELGHTQGGGTVFGGDENLRLVERFTRTGDDAIDYEFTVDDMNTWTSSWSAEVPMVKTEGPMYEYACHEGNYDIRHILEIYRNLERQAAAEASSLTR